MPAPRSESDPAQPEDILDAAAVRILDVAPAERDRVLEELVGEHPQHEPALRRMARELADVEHTLDLGYPDCEPAILGEIGAYQVQERLGTGAFGSVYLCHQERPVQRQVAIKVLRSGIADSLLLTRFAAERQVLAQLGHPAIAQVFDAGALPDGRPFLVMEYVDGLPITGYCLAHELSVAARVDLFLEVCRGVAHAHHHGIAHRDLKPANVLVIDSESGPLPKIIDFGIAKVLDRDAASATPRTETGIVVGTPGYMSPEQAAGRNDQVDARSDVFGLGVMLFELLTGALPWPHGAAATDTDAPRPSDRVATATGRGGAERTSAQRRRVASAVRGDLDWITLQALSREPGQRYQSVLELIDDLSRFRRGDPIAAGPPSVAYRLRRFCRRHSIGVAAAAAVVLVGGIVIPLALSYTSAADSALAAARHDADENLDQAERAVQSLLVRANDPVLRSAAQSDALRQALLDDALGFYDRLLASRPATASLREGRCRVLVSLAYVHWLLGQFDRSEAIADEAAAEATVLQEAAPDQTSTRGLLAQARRRKACVLGKTGRTVEALEYASTAVTLLERCFAADPGQFGSPFAAALRELATMQSALDQNDESAAAYRRSVQVLEQLDQVRPGSAETLRDLVMARLALGQELMFADKLAEADAELRRAEECLPRLPADQVEVRSKVSAVLAHLEIVRQDHPAAIERLQTTIALTEQWRQQHPERLLPHHELSNWFCLLASAYEAIAALDDASAAYQQAIALAETMVRQFPQDPTRPNHLARVLNRQARALWARSRQADLADAESCARRALATSDGQPATSGAALRAERWEAALSLAQILTARGAASAPEWQDVVGTIEEQTPTSLRVEALLGLVRCQLAAAEDDVAAATLARARGILDAHQLDPMLAVQADSFAATLAARRADHAGAARAADAILRLGVTVSDKQRAADALAAAWHCAASRADVDAAIALGYRDRAAAIYREIVDRQRETAGAPALTPIDALQLGQASVHLAQIEAERGAAATARELLRVAMPMLEQVHDQVHADQWDEGLFAAGTALAVRLQ